MGICSYLVFPRPGATTAVAARLAALPGCEVTRAENRDLLLLVTETNSAEADAALCARIAAWQDVQSLVLTFGRANPEEVE